MTKYQCNFFYPNNLNLLNSIYFKIRLKKKNINSVLLKAKGLEMILIIFENPDPFYFMVHKIFLPLLFS